MKNKFGFILVKPQLGENIGACARSIKNFGFNKLNIVSPKFPFFFDTLAGAIPGRFNITRCWSDCTTICIYNSHDGTYWYIFVHTDGTYWYILMVNPALKSAQSDWKHINRSLVLNHGFSLTQHCDIMQMVD